MKNGASAQSGNIFSSKKLNAFERGLLQKIFIFLVYLVNITALLFFLDWLDRCAYLKVVAEFARQGKITENIYQLFVKVIESRDDTEFIHIILLGVACALIAFWFIRLAAKLQWSKAVQLAEAVEFRQAMEKIGIHDPDDRIDFVRKHGVPVYIAAHPFIGMTQEGVRARLYAFADSLSIGNRETFNIYTGQQRLCFAGEDYALLQRHFGQQAEAALSARLVALEDSLTALRSELALKQTEIEQVKAENGRLKEENEAYRNKARTAAGREKRIDRREEGKSPFRRVAYPLVNRLISQAGAEEKYTRAQIQVEFMRELAEYPELEEPVSELFRKPKDGAAGMSFDLSGWAMEEIRSALGNYVQKEPGRQK